MTTLTFNAYYTLIAAVLVLLLGSWLVRKIKFLQDFNIPEPVAGGLVAALVLFGVHTVQGVNFQFEKPLQDAFMLVFFSSIGLSADFARLRQGGRPLVIFIIAVSAFIIVQNVVGTVMASMLGLDARIGYFFIALFGRKTLGIGYSLALSELLLAPVTPSNTARAGGIIHPVMKAIAASYDSDPEKGTQGRMGRYLALVNYHGNPISSAMFITATAPNPLVVDIVAKATNSSIKLSWGTWALAMLLPGLAAMLLMPLALYWLYPPEIRETPNAAAFAKERLAELGPMNRGEKIMLAIFALLLALWAGVPAHIGGPAWAVDATATAFIGLSLLLLTGMLSWEDVLKEKSAWDTIT